MAADLFTREDVNAIARHYQQRIDEAGRPRARLRTALIALLVALPIVFALGRGTGDRGLTIRAAEAAPVPSELPFLVSRFHDDAQGATCWMARAGKDAPTGLSCLPDQWLKPAQIAAEGDAP